jgi:hypothetical protein
MTWEGLRQRLHELQEKLGQRIISVFMPDGSERKIAATGGEMLELCNAAMDRFGAEMRGQLVPVTKWDQDIELLRESRASNSGLADLIHAASAVAFRTRSGEVVTVDVREMPELKRAARARACGEGTDRDAFLDRLSDYDLGQLCSKNPCDDSGENA